MDDRSLLEVLVAASAAVRGALDDLDDWRPAGERAGQYRLDLVADAAALAVLHGAGLTVLSEESGMTGPGGARVEGPAAARSGSTDHLLAVLDPVDGSTNASIGLPWYATSICVLDAEGPRLALVENQASGARYEAVRGAGARRDGDPISPSGCHKLGDAVIGVSGYPGAHPGWGQFRALGSAALDHCLVAEGVLDGYRLLNRSWLHGWDYLGGMLVCTEAGAPAADLHGDDLVVRDRSRRSPVVAATPELLSALLDTPG